MRIGLLSIVLFGCTGSNDHAITGKYQTKYGDVVTVRTEDGDRVDESVVEITATDETGVLYDGYFHDQTIEPELAGNFEVHVPDGATGVHLLFKQFTFDGRDPTVEGIVDGPVTSDIDVGLIVVSHP